MVLQLLEGGQMTSNPDKLAAFFALLDQRQRDEQTRQEQERKEKEDGKLTRLKPWYMQASQ